MDDDFDGDDETAPAPVPWLAMTTVVCVAALLGLTIVTFGRSETAVETIAAPASSSTSLLETPTDAQAVTDTTVAATSAATSPSTSSTSTTTTSTTSTTSTSTTTATTSTTTATTATTATTSTTTTMPVQVATQRSMGSGRVESCQGGPSGASGQVSVTNTGPVEDTFAVAVAAVGRDGQPVVSSLVTVPVPAGGRVVAAYQITVPAGLEWTACDVVDVRPA